MCWHLLTAHTDSPVVVAVAVAAELVFVAAVGNMPAVGARKSVAGGSGRSASGFAVLVVQEKASPDQAAGIPDEVSVVFADFVVAGID